MKWLLLDAMLVVHQRQMREHGGRPGVRSLDLLESALARPRNKSAYGRADIHACAAAYGFAIARNHPFVDGNRRMALLSIYMFLRLNGYRLTAEEPDAYTAIMALAAGDLSERQLAAWIKAHVKRIPRS
jgi:death-on-curing protein